MNTTPMDNPINRNVIWVKGGDCAYNGQTDKKVRFMDNQKLLKTGLIGSIVMVICCFTPVLVILLGALGLSAYVAGLDFILLPALGICLVILIVALVRRKKTATRSTETP